MVAMQARQQIALFWLLKQLCEQMSFHNSDKFLITDAAGGGAGGGGAANLGRARGEGRGAARVAMIGARARGTLGAEGDVVLRRQLRVRIRLQVRQRLRRVQDVPWDGRGGEHHRHLLPGPRHGSGALQGQRALVRGRRRRERRVQVRPQLHLQPVHLQVISRINTWRRHGWMDGPDEGALQYE